MPAVQNKAMNRMVEIMVNYDLSYNPEGKQLFKKTSMAALRQLAKDLEIQEFKATFNEGGMAVSGEAILMGMWDKGNGICVYLSQGFGGSQCMYRTIKHMKDHRGGPNQWVAAELLASDYGTVAEKMRRLKR